MKGDNIADRLLDFSVRVVHLVGQLPQTPVGKHVARQLIRSGTAGGANYEEARGAESRADFAHKVSLALKEVRESIYWLRLIQRARLVRSAQLPDVVREGKELAAILRSSANTAKRRAG
jgi:four helix bundle protein